MRYYSQIEVTPEFLADQEFVTDDLLFKEVAKKLIETLSIEDLGKVFELSKLDFREDSFKDYINDYRNPSKQRDLRQKLRQDKLIRFDVSINIK